MIVPILPRHRVRPRRTAAVPLPRAIALLWCSNIIALFFVVLSSSRCYAYELVWSTGTKDLAVQTANPCTLIVRSTVAREPLPVAWRLLWAGRAETQSPIAFIQELPVHDIATVCSVLPPTVVEDVLSQAALVDFCSGSTGVSRALVARYILRIDPSLSGRIRLVPPSTALPEAPLRSEALTPNLEVTVNGGSDLPVPPYLSEVAISRHGNLLSGNLLGAGLRDIASVQFVPDRGPAPISLTIVSLSDTLAQVEAVLPGRLPAGRIVATSTYGAKSSIWLAPENDPCAPAWIPNGRPVCQAIGPQTEPSIVSDGDQGAIIAWADARGANMDIYVQRVDKYGCLAWTPDSGVAVCSAPGNQYSPVITSDGSSGAIIAWVDARDSTNVDIYAQRVTEAGAVAWTADGVALCTAAGTQQQPTIVSDGNHGAIVAWQDLRRRSAPPLTNKTWIVAGHATAEGAVNWVVNGSPVDTLGDDADPVAVADGSGGAYVGWDRDPGGGNLDVYLARVSSGGTTIPLAHVDAPGSQTVPVLAVDDFNGDILAAWQDTRLGAPLIFAGRFDELTGAPVSNWPADGRRATPGLVVGTNQFSPAIAALRLGGAIVAWTDTRSGVGDVYAQRFSVDTTLSWDEGGIAVCAGAGTGNRYPLIAPMIGGPSSQPGAIVTWTDGRAFGTRENDIYAQLVDSAGNLGWPGGTAAFPIDSLGGEQTAPAITTDGHDGAIITWQDRRSGVFDIYAQHVTWTGQTVDVPPTRRARLKVDAPSPNPATKSTTVRFSLAKASRCEVAAFDMQGRRVARLLASNYMGSGDHKVTWDLTAEDRRLVPIGIYMLAVRVDDGVWVKRVVVIR